MNIRQIPQILEVRSEDDLSSIFEKLTEDPSQEVYIVIPPDVHLLRNSLNVQLLQKQIGNKKKRITIVTEDEGIARAARRSNLSVISYLPPELHVRGTGEEAGRFVERNTTEDRMSVRKVYDIIPPKTFISEHDLPSIVSSSEYPETIEGENPESYEPEFEEGIQEREPDEVEEVLVSESKKSFRLPSVVLPRVPGLRLGRRPMFVWVAFVLVIILGAILYVSFIPRTKVIIKPQREAVSVDIDIQASTNLSRPDKDGNIPAQHIRVTKDFSKDFLSSGEEERQEKARGIITLYNAYSSSPQTLVETTRLVSQDGRTFRTTKTVVIPGARLDGGEIIPSSIDVEVIAAETGTEYNIGPSTFSIPGLKGTPKYTGFYGKSTSSMQGGFIGKLRVVQDEDVARAKETFTSELENTLREDFSDQVPKDFKLLDEAKSEEIFDITVSKKAGEVADSFTVSGKATLSALLFDESHVREILRSTLARHVEGRDLSIEDLPQTLLYRNIHADLQDETLTFSIHVEENLVRAVDTEEMKTALRGKNEIEVRKYLGSREDIENARVVFFPRFFVRTVPDDLRKIEIVIEY